MPELRWALIGLGVLFLAGLALWEWRRGRRYPRPVVRAESVGDITLTTERPRRIEPGLEEVMGALSSRSEEKLEVPSIRMERVPLSPESAVDVPAVVSGARGGTSLSRRLVALDDAPAAAGGHLTAPAEAETSAAGPGQTRSLGTASAAVRWPPSRSERVLTLRIVRTDGEPLPGRALRGALEAAGLAPGPQTIYHRADVAGEVIVSAANLLRPGKLDPGHMDAEEFRGVSLFSVLPGPLPAVRMLEELVATARSIAHRLGAVVQDETGEDLDGLRLTALRRSLPEARGDGNA